MPNKKAYTYLWLLLKKIKTSLFSREVLIFLFFVVLSSVLWLLHSLSKATEIKIIVPVSYSGIPENVELIEQLPSSINVRVKDIGSNLASYIFYKAKKPINFNLRKKFSTTDKQIFLSPKDLRRKVLSYIDPTATILEINPDTVFIKYVRLYKKNLPVKIAGKVTLAQQYMLSNAITITPSHISVYGRKSILDTMQYVYTEKLNLEGIKDTLTKDVDIQKKSKLKYSTSSITLFVPVEMYTEKIVDIPIAVKNVPPRIQVKTFPSFAKVTCKIGLSRFNLLSAKDFDISVDYHELIKNKTGRQKLNVHSSAEYISDFQVAPQEVEFILENKY